MGTGRKALRVRHPTIVSISAFAAASPHPRSDSLLQGIAVDFFAGSEVRIACHSTQEVPETGEGISTSIHGRPCVVEDEAYTVAALRYLDRNPVRAGFGEDPIAYPWSNCGAYACGLPHHNWCPVPHCG